MATGSPLLLFACGLLTALVLVGAVWVVTLRNLFRAALSLGVVLLGVAGLFVLLEAEFLAFVQILVYVGAVLTLVVFAIMLTAKLQTSDETVASHRQQPMAAFASGALFLLLIVATQSLLLEIPPESEAISVNALGQQLVTRLILPFEVVSLVLVAALMGAIAVAVARSDRPAP